MLPILNESWQHFLSTLTFSSDILSHKFTFLTRKVLIILFLSSERSFLKK